MIIHKITRNSKPQPIRGLGDLVERAAKPIAKALKMSCLDEKGQLKPVSPCGKRRDALNARFPFPSQKTVDKKN